VFLERHRHLEQIRRLLRRHRVVALLGARQVGKTTLARMLAARSAAPTAFFDLEDPRDIARLSDPMLALADLRGLVFLDEVQRRPDLFPVLRVLADRPRGAHFLALGSASPELLRQASESLAGRIAFHTLGGLALDEVGESQWRRLWERGGFPRSFTARSRTVSAEWREAFVATFLERDLPQLGVRTSGPTLRRFWSMLAHYHGQIWNSSEFARSFGVSDTTVRHYLDLLSATFVVRQLAPWHANVAKRQVKSPKVYVEDSGLLHTLLDIRTPEQLERHPKVGASWEGFCLGQVVEHLGAKPQECFFWATHAGAELDLLVVRGAERRGFEFKRTTAPAATRSMRTAVQDLKLESLEVIHAGHDAFQLAPKVHAVPLDSLLESVRPLRGTSA
jgi:predicted AAA+ superfamily ATPase